MADQPRRIIHVDLDACYASVEELLDPTLAGKPIIVGGDPAQRGVVSSASYAARAYGVRSAMPVSQALRLCPQAIVIPPHPREYERRSRAIMALLHEITPTVEPISIDEAFLDVTGCELLWGSVEQISHLIQGRILDEHGLDVSLGIASSKLVAKIACGTGKPKGLVIVLAGEEAAFLAPLPIESLWGVGRVTGARLRALGIQTIGDLARWQQDALQREFGELGQMLYAYARGIDTSPVHTARERRSISQERTFGQDVADAQILHQALLKMTERVSARLRAHKLTAQTVRIKLRFPDFTTITRQVTLLQPTDQTGLIHAQAETLLSAAWPQGQPVRLLGIAVSGLLERSGYQLGLFERTDQRRIRLDRTVDEIRSRYGDRAIVRASLLPGTGERGERDALQEQGKHDEG